MASAAGVRAAVSEPLVGPEPWATPQREGPPVGIDIHTHWAPPAYLKAKEELGRPDFLDPINFDLERRRTWMRQHGVRMGLLTLGGFRPWGWVTPAEGAHLAQVSNDAAVEAHLAYPDTFIGGIELNCSDPAGSIAELNRMARAPGMVCAHLPTSLAGRDFLFEPSFAQVIARAEELGLPILLHPLDGEENWFGGRRLADRASGVKPNDTGVAVRFPGLTNSVGNSLEIATVMGKIMASGMLDQHPDLTFIVTQGGGALPYIAGRIASRSARVMERPVAEYLRRFYYDSLVYWPEALRYLVSVAGADRVVLGTDNMFGPGNQLTPQPHSVIDQAGFSEAERELILEGNLIRLFRLQEE